MRRGLPAALAALALVGAGAMAAAQQTVVVTGDACRRATVHVPADDVAYKPGVDAYGRPVAPADLPGSPVIKTPTELSFDVLVDLQKRFNIPATSSLFGEPSVGTVKVDLNTGQVTYNGQPLTDPELAAIAAACRAQAKPGK